MPRKGLGVPLVRIGEVDVGELEDMVQDWIDRENQHIRGASIPRRPLEEYERLKRLPGPRKKTPTPPSSKEYYDERLGMATRQTLGREH